MNEFLKQIDTLSGGDPQAIDLCRRAFEFAQKAHQGQKRASGEPYSVVENSAYFTPAPITQNANSR